MRESFTTKAGHRGHGLTLVRELVEKCGGEITFSSRPGRGSLFSIALPIAKQERVGARETRGAAKPVAAERAGAQRAGQPALQVLALENSPSAGGLRSARLKRATKDELRPQKDGLRPQVVLQP